VSSKAGEVQPLDGKLAMDKVDFQKALRLPYEIMGWDTDTGIPIRSKLIELGLHWLVDEIK